MAIKVQLRPLSPTRINALAEAFRDQLRVHASEFDDVHFEYLLAEGRIGERLLRAMRNCPRADDLMVRCVDVDLTVQPERVVNMAMCDRVSQKEVLASMPRPIRERAVIIFFRCTDHTDDSLCEEFQRRGLIPADPYTLAAVNNEDVGFWMRYRTGTHWRNEDGRWCHARFLPGTSSPVVLFRNDDGETWDGGWWFAGVEPLTEPK